MRLRPLIFILILGCFPAARPTSLTTDTLERTFRSVLSDKLKPGENDSTSMNDSEWLRGSLVPVRELFLLGKPVTPPAAPSPGSVTGTLAFRQKARKEIRAHRQLTGVDEPLGELRFEEKGTPVVDATEEDIRQAVITELQNELLPGSSQKAA